MPGVQTCALRSEEHTSELQSHDNIVCRLLLEKKTTKPACRTTCRSSASRPRAAVTAAGDQHGAGAWAGSAAAPPHPDPGHGTFFFFNDRAPAEIYPLPPPGPLPI